MKAVIIGAGQVGRAVADALAAEHDVIVVDYNPERLERVRFESDVMTVEGNGIDLSVLETAGVRSADLTVGAASDDRTNILICNTAKALSAETFTVARVAETEYLATWSHLRTAFNVDVMVGADYLTARTVVEVAGLRAAREVELFAGGQVEMAEFDIPVGSPLVGRRVRNLDLPERINLVALFQGDRMEIVRGETRLRSRARLVVIGPTEDVQQFGAVITRPAAGEAPRRVMILGGGEIGFQTARLLEERGVEPRLVEWDAERARFLAENLPNTLVLQSDATDPDFLEREGITDADVVVAALTPDERNLLASLLSKKRSAARVVAVVHEAQYESVFEASGIDVTVNPRREVIEEILRHTRKRALQKIAFVEHHRGEVIEVELSAGSPLAGRPLQDAIGEMPRELVIGAVTRDGQVLVPRGNTTLQPGDHLVVFVDAKVLDEALEVL